MWKHRKKATDVLATPFINMISLPRVPLFLCSCGVATKSFNYDRVAHSEFVTAWPLLGLEQLRDGADGNEGLPNYARDLAQILEGVHDFR